MKRFMIPRTAHCEGGARSVLTTVNCPAIIPVVNVKAGAGSRGGRGR